jgi:predicted small secreted protein
MKKTLKTLIAVILAAAMLTACGAAEDVSADGDNRLTRAEEEAENAEVTAKEDTAKPAGGATGEEAADTADATAANPAETTAQAEATATTTAATVTGLEYLPDTAFVYERDYRPYIIDIESGEVIVDLNSLDNSFEKKSFKGIVENRLKFTVWPLDEIEYYDKNLEPAPAPEVPDGSVNGKFIVREGNYYGVTDTDGNVLVDAVYDKITGSKDYSLFRVEINGAKGVVNDKGETIIPVGKDPDYYSLTIFDNNIIFVNKSEEHTLYNAKGEVLKEFPTGDVIYHAHYLGQDNIFVWTPYDAPSFSTIYNSKGEIVKENVITNETLSASKYKTFALISDLTDYNENTTLEIGEDNFVSLFSVGDYRSSSYDTLIDSQGNVLFPPQNNGLVKKFAKYPGGYFLYFETNNNKKILFFNDNNKLLQTFENFWEVFFSDSFYLVETIDEERHHVYTILDSSFNEIYSGRAECEISRNAAVVSDESDTFFGLYIGDTLMYPCEYTEINFVADGNIAVLKKGNTETLVTTKTGAVITLPQ